MSTSKKRSLVFIIIFLLLTNIAILGYFLYFKKDQKSNANTANHNGMATALKNDVGFTDEQIAQYKKMKEEQWKKFKPMFDEVRKAKDSLYRLLGNENANDSVISNTAALIGEKQKVMELQAFRHFQNIRTICTPGQLAKYDSLIPRMVKKMGKLPKSDQGKKENK